MNDPAHPIDVAVGVIYDPRGRVLVNQRPAGKPFAGQWEFPGGKLQHDETPDQALLRELREELGIVVASQRPLISLTYRYPDIAVRLHAREVLAYEGTPQGREGQLLRWVEPAQLRHIDLLSGNVAIINAMILPRTCLITDASRFGVDHTLRRLTTHAGRQRLLLIVREKSMPGDHLRRFMSKCREICRPGGSLLCVHADCDSVASERVDGVHRSALDRTYRGRLCGDGLSGLSCHSPEELQRASDEGADYVLLSPVRRTASHPEVEPLGWERFSDLCHSTPTLVYALGGMEFSDLGTAIENGGHGVALLSAAWR